MALCVTIVSALVIGTGFAAYFIDAKSKADSETRLRTLADAAIEGIVITEGRQNRLDVNTSFERLTARDRRLASGREALFPGLFDHRRRRRTGQTCAVLRANCARGRWPASPPGRNTGQARGHTQRRGASIRYAICPRRKQMRGASTTSRISIR